MHIKIGNYDLHDSGIIIVPENNVVAFVLAVDLTISLVFKSDDDPVKYKIESNLINDHELELYLMNFDKESDSGNVDPLRVGTLNKRELFLSFLVKNHVRMKHRLLSYTFLLGKEVTHE